MVVPILKQGHYLIATIPTALTDADLQDLRDGLVAEVGLYRSRGVVVDITALDVMDSFAVRTVRDIAHMTRLRGAETVIVGIQPEVEKPLSRAWGTLGIPGPSSRATTTIPTFPFRSISFRTIWPRLA